MVQKARCVVMAYVVLQKYVYDNKMTDKTTITVETLSGIKTLVLNVEDDKVKTVRVNMGSQF